MNELEWIQLGFEPAHRPEPVPGSNLNWDFNFDPKSDLDIFIMGTWPVHGQLPDQQ